MVIVLAGETILRKPCNSVNQEIQILRRLFVLNHLALRNVTGELFLLSKAFCRVKKSAGVTSRHQTACQATALVKGDGKRARRKGACTETGDGEITGATGC
jgi:hypothetical protein